MPIEITHPKVISFYQKHPEINVEDVNLCMVNFMETIFLNSNEQNKNENITELLLRKISKLETFFTENDTQNNYKKNIAEQIQSTNDVFKGQIIEIFDKSSQEKANDNNDNNENIKKMLFDTLEVKMEDMFQKLQQPMTNIMNESERRVTTKLETIHSLTDKNNTTQDSLSKSLTDYLNKLKHSSSLKGQYSENKLLMILENMYPQSNIENINMEKTAKTKRSGDIILYRDESKQKILIENKIYESKNVPEDEVKKFIRDIDEQKCHGIMLSQSLDKGISGKKTFQIDFHKKYILIYVDKVNYDQFKIGLAVDIIDKLYIKLKPFLCDTEMEENKYEISSDILESINSEFQKFIKCKEEFYTEIQDTNKKLLRRLDDLQFPSLDVYLKNIFASFHQTNIKCDICSREFGGRHPSKALARHISSCKKKHNQKSEHQEHQEQLEIIIET